MGVKIKMVSVAHSGNSIFGKNSISLSARSAKQCLEDAGLDPCDLGLIINTGIYRYRNTGEPAIAAIIQEKISKKRNNKDDQYNNRSTFSFDLINGACGLLSGIEIVDGLIKSGEISHGMVVTGDSEPFPGLSGGFSFNSAAAAIILSRSDDNKGFCRFRTYNYPEYSDEFTSSTQFERRGTGRKGKNVLNIIQKASYAGYCIDCAVRSLLDFYDESGIKPDEIHLILPSQSPRGFAGMMKERTGMGDNFIELPDKGKKVLHSAGPLFALKKVWDDNRFINSANIIFLTVGSGISVSITLYKN